MADSLSDLYVSLTANIAPLLAAFTEAGAAGDRMAAQITAAMAEVKAAMTEVDAGMAAGGASGMAAGLTEAAAAEQAMATETATAMTEVEASVARADTAFASMATSAKTASTETAAAVQAEAAAVAASTAEVEAAVARGDAGFAQMAAAARASAVEVEASIAAETAKLGELSAATEAAAVKAEAANAKVGESMAATGGASTGLASALGISNKALLGVGVVAAGVGLEAAKMAGDFQQSTVRLITGAGLVKDSLGQVQQGILTMSAQTGTSAETLATAMYKVSSAGFDMHKAANDGANGLKVLQAAAEGAKAGNADLVTVADAVSTALLDYHKNANDAADVTSKMVAAEQSGKMTFEEMAGSLNSILPIASAAKISFSDIMGSLAAMTMHGISASQAADNLADAVRHLQNPTMAQSKELAALGLNATEVSKNLGPNGLSGTINEISNRIQSQMGPDGMVVVNLKNAFQGLSPAVQQLAAKVLDGSMSLKDFSAASKGLPVLAAKQAQSFATLAGSVHTIGTESKSGAEVFQTYSGAMQKAMGTATGLKVALQISGENASNAARAIKNVSDATTEAGGHVKGWAEIQGEFNQKLAQAKAGMDALAISIGEKLLPILTPVIGALASMASWMASHKVVAEALAITVGVVLVAAFAALALKGLTALANLAAGFVLDMAKGAVWVATKIGQLLGVTAAAETEAVAETAAAERGNAMKLAGAIASGAKWLVVKTAQGVAAVASAVYYSAASYLPWVAASAKQLASATVDGAKWLAVKAAQGVAAAASAVLNAAAVTAAWVAASAKQLASAIADGAKWLATVIAQNVAAAASATLQAGLAVAAWMAATAKMVADQVAKGAIWLASWIATGVAAAASSVMEAAVAAAAWVAANLAIIAATGGIILIIGALIAIGYVLITHWNDVKRIAGEVWDWIKNAVSTAWDAIKNAVTTGIDWVVNLFSGLPGKLLNAIGNIASLFWNVGMDILKGIWAGIQAGWSWLTSNISNLASSLFNAAKSALGIGSPSKVFADEVGQWIGPGIAQGLNATAHVATQAAKNLARDVTQAAQTGSGSGLSVSVGGDGGGAATGSGSLFTAGLTASGSRGGVTLNVNVQGHVWTTQDLVRELQQELLRHGIRNVGNATNYAFS